MTQTIYKKDSKGKIRFLTVQCIGHVLKQISGIVGTSSPVCHDKICTPKNIGKSNETTSSEQAIIEAYAIIKDKKTKGYFDTESEAEQEFVVLPMLAKEYKKESKKIDWDNEIVYVQPKLDGQRCLKLKKELTSRTGKKISNMGHIEAELNQIVHILDGELYVHGEDFQTNMEFIKKYRKGDSERIKYHVYDIIVPGLKFSERFEMLTGIADMFPLVNIELVPTYIVLSEDELNKFHQEFLEQGYEGTMIRRDLNYDINKRSSSLLKKKDFQDIALLIKDVIPCKNETTWGEPIFDWPGAKGHRMGEDILGCNTKLSHEMRIDLLKNKENYIGKTAEVRFFEFSNTGVPRFPVMVGIRNDK